MWIREHLDPCLRELLTPLGPFADCSHSERVRILTPHAPLPTLPTLTPQQAADDPDRRHRCPSPTKVTAAHGDARPRRNGRRRTRGRAGRVDPRPRPRRHHRHRDGGRRTPTRRRGRGGPGEDPRAGPEPARRHHHDHRPQLPRTPTAVGHRPGRRPNPGGTPPRPARDRNGGAAGLYQLNQANWTAAGGHPWTTSPPARRRRHPATRAATSNWPSRGSARTCASPPSTCAPAASRPTRSTACWSATSPAAPAS